MRSGSIPLFTEACHDRANEGAILGYKQVDEDGLVFRTWVRESDDFNDSRDTSMSPGGVGGWVWLDRCEAVLGSG